ncbi:hypothetical protein MSAN_01140200 [Mycena sanguinolenta]|uniref:Uncharacterized protein n=1 Tax=Mycena sanguinolenta TaxID=230812 RepID=A0A8H7D4F5_9AGAR|nr:hypothetical protein MSAN_01140200 [Mycena sanguinolenta]
MPETVRRYDRKAVISPEPTTFRIPPLTISFLPNKPPPGWTACQHPEGALYFFHEEKRVFTDANLFDTETLLFINKYERIVNHFLSTHNVHLDPGVDLVLDKNISSDGIRECQYYFVNHVGRCVFWIDNVESDLFPVTVEVKGMKSASHIRHEIEAQYWRHCEYYPRAFAVTYEILDELRDIVLYAFGDVVTSEATTVSWKIDDLRDMITFIAGFSENIGKYTENKVIVTNCLVGRLMHSFARHRAYHFHGEPEARLTVDQSVHATVRKRTMFVMLLDLLLFGVPRMNLLRLQAVNAGELIQVNHRAGHFVECMMREWQDSIINAAVILAANVGFLSIQSVDQGGNIVSTRSPAQIASYMSVLTSILSMVSGLAASNVYRNRDTTAPSWPFTNHTQLMRYLEMIAVLDSLPLSMLCWSILSFFVAFSFMCIQSFNLVAIILFFGVECLFVTITLLGVVYMWGSSWDLVPDFNFKAEKWRRVLSWPIAVFREMYDSEQPVMNV